MNTKTKNMIQIVGLIFAFALVIFVAYSDCHYYREGYIIHTVFDNYVVFVDDTGNEWEMFTDGRSFNDGQRVRVTMFDNNTHTHIKDDKCVDFKFIN